MKNELQVFENEFMNEGVSTLVCDDLNAKTTTLTYLLREYAIVQKREVLFYTFDRRCDYYYRHLLACISKIDKSLLIKYLYPWLGFSHYNTDMINRFYFVGAIEKVQQSNLFMIGENATTDTDYLDSILEMLEFDTSTLIVIEDFDLLLERTKYSRKEALRKIREYSKKYEAHFILVCYKKNNHLEFLKLENSSMLFASSPLLTNQKTKRRTLEIKSNKNEKLEKILTIEYNKHNYEIEKREVR